MAFSLNRWNGKVCIVTGASSGIGAALVEQLAISGLTVVAAARRVEKLEELIKALSQAKGKVYSFPTDVTNESSISSLFEWVTKNVGPVSILINSAGVGRITTLIDGDTKLWKETLDTNVLGLSIATREAVRCMKANNIDGHIVHINSLAGHKLPAHAYFNVYPASKFAVTALTETLRQELQSIGSKIKVTSISPGLVRTDIHETAAVASGQTELWEILKPTFKEFAHLEITDVVNAVVYALSTPPHVQVQDILLNAVISVEESKQLFI